MNLNENHKLVRGIDYAAYYDNHGKGWKSLAEANAGVPFKHRDKVTVLVDNVEYWWDAGITDADLVVKDKNDITPVATTTTPGKVKKAAAQADSTATLVEGVTADFNALLAKLRAAGIMDV